MKGGGGEGRETTFLCGVYVVDKPYKSVFVREMLVR